MNWKKNLLLTLVTGVILTGAFLITPTSQAAIATQAKHLKMEIPTYRTPSGYAYKLGLRSASETTVLEMWKIYEYNSNNQTPKNENSTIYCLKMGVGFGSVNGSPTEDKTYTKYADMKNPQNNDSDIINEYKKQKLDNSDERYNSLMWVLDHCYVPAPTTASEEEQQQAQAYKKELLKAADIEDSIISDDLIDIVQQVAIWYFTNTDKYKAEEITTIYAQKKEEDTNYQNIEDVFGDFDLPDEVKALYQYFIDEGESHKDTPPTTTDAINPIQLNSTGAKVTLHKAEDGSQYYLAGPYTITKEENREFTISASVNNSNNFTLLDQSKQQTTDIKTLADNGQPFYIKISKDGNTNIENVELTITTKVKQNTITYWEVNGSSSNAEQPVVEIKPEEKTFTAEAQLNPSNFDLALRKFITKVNETTVPTREPSVQKETLTNNTTATKTHTKDPVQVNPGDTVTYTIRIYNEGDISGYATKVTDYLPEGLKLKDNSQINTDNQWHTENGNERIISSTKLADELIDAYVSGQEVQYKDLQVECEVIATNSSTEQKLKNIAEITEAKDSDHQTIVDRDSIPNNLQEEQRNNYTPQKPTEGIGVEDDDDYEELLIPGKTFDLALRKFVTSINDKELKKDENTYTREPSIDLTLLKQATATTANYNHQKNPQGVSVGDIVIYTIRIYNEGQLDGYVSEVTDYLPPQLEFINDNFNAKYGWVLDEGQRKVTTTILAKKQDENGIYADENENNLIKAFDGNNLSYKELKIKCKVVATENLEKTITNIAEITGFTDAEGKQVTDRDSQKQNANIPDDTKLPDYKGNDTNKSVLNDANYFYQGQQDDDDFEKLILEEFDLALRKFITQVNDTPITSRIPKFTNVKDSNGNYIYEHSKEPIEVETTDIVEYTIRIYNEGDIAGYAKEITDNIPEGLEFVPENATNQEYRWVMLDENGEKTEDVSKAVKITTDYLSKTQEQEEGSNLIAPFDSTKTSPDYKDVKVAFKVVAPSTYTGIITNIAEISDDSDETGNEVEDRDSIPDNNNEKEDDIDKEHLKLTYFDLALRKFITAVNDTEVTNRVPKFTVTEDGKYTYEHTKEPVEVENGNIVTYTLRIYNEGSKDGYAKEIKDDLPEGLEFLPENETNKEYGWVMVDENGEETENVSEAVSVKTDYLSKEQGDLNQRDNLLTKFDVENMQEPDYRDIKIAFKVTEPNTSDRILINQAQISDDSDKDGKDVIDNDSTPDKWIEDEDDQDIEKVKVKYFDLSLRKWVTEAIVIDEGKETVTQTGHKAEDDPEELVKVEIKESRLNKVVVKFRYKIRVKNEGEIAGYATEISDYIPEGLKFVAEDNPSWKEADGKIVTDALKDTLLQPGETAEVEVLLTWINGKNNFGEKINVAEISKDKNDSDTPDIDSTPNNKKPEEDDIDDAPVILSVKTGLGINPQYIIVTTISLGILASGTVLIKKYIL